MDKDLEIRCYETQDGMKFQIIDCSAITVIKKQFDKFDNCNIDLGKYYELGIK